MCIHKFLVVLLTGYNQVFAPNGVEEMNQLWSNLTSNFQNFHPPAQLTNNTVYLFGDLFQILEVDERRGVIILKMFIYHFYHSEFAKWDPNMYNGTKLIMAQKGTFWDPPIGMKILPEKSRYKRGEERSKMTRRTPIYSSFIMHLYCFV